MPHRLDCCPGCGVDLQRCNRTRTIEDILEAIRPIVTEHTIHRDYCPCCKKHVEPIVADALPKAAIGHRLVGLTCWFHYGLGITIDQVVSILSHHLQTKLTPGGLVDMWQRVAVILEPWYQQIGEQARASVYLHADETGWRVNGQTYWLWCFTNPSVCYYMIDPSRGGPALKKFFIDAFDGVLITDFWRAYDCVLADGRQFCLVHLLRELEKVDLTNQSQEWRSFAKKLRRIVRDAIRLRRRDDYDVNRYWNRFLRLDKRLWSLAVGTYKDKDAKRLANRVAERSDWLLSFLQEPILPFDNNFAERQIRPAVILRKNSQCNRSEKGSATQAIMMSIYRTLRLRGLDPMRTIVDALRIFLTDGKLTPLPPPAVADG